MSGLTLPHSRGADCAAEIPMDVIASISARRRVCPFFDGAQKPFNSDS